MNNRQLQKNKKSIIIVITYINVIICSVLFISMIVFASIYIIKSQYYNVKIDDDIPIDTLLILKQGNTTISDTFNVSFITPEFIGFNFEKGNVGTAGNAEVTKDIYSTVSEYIEYVFGNNYLSSRKDSVSGEAVWKSCLAGGDYIYIKYPASLPSVVINAFFNKQKTGFSYGILDDGVVFIREMFLLFNHYGEELYGIHAVTRDDNGNITVFDYDYAHNRPRQYFKINNILSYYVNHLLVRYEFAGNYQKLSDFKLPLKDTAIIYSKDLTARDIIVSNINDIRFSDNSADLILRQFNFNPDKLNSFINTDGTLVYIETHGELKILSDKIIYTANNKGGIDISDYLSYGIYNGNYDIFEIIKATGIIIDSIRKIDAGFLGGDSGIRIGDISYDRENDYLIIEYNYYFENIKINIKTENYSACRFVIKDNKIISVVIHSVEIKGSADVKMNYPQLWMLEKIGNMIDSSSPGEMDLRYFIYSGVNAMYSTQWVYHAERDLVSYITVSDTGKDGVANKNEVD